MTIMKKSLSMTTLAAVALAGVAVLATAEPQGQPRQGRGGEGRLQRMTEYLGLTEDQQAAWKSLHEQQKTEMEPLRQEGRELHQRLKSAIEAENPDPTAVGAATLALKQHREKAKAAHLAFTEKLARILTPEQKAKFEAFQAKHQGGPGQPGAFEGRRGPRHGRPGPPPAGEAPAPDVEG
jgi:Spy/CpxP family protein refolding chaperone